MVSVNHTFDWLVTHIPPAKQEGRFYSYAFVFENAYGYSEKNAGRYVRKDLEELIYELCRFHYCAVQLGVKSNGKRGIRIMNLR